MSEPMIDQELLRDLIQELRTTDSECLRLFDDMANVACTRTRGHDGPCAHACDRAECAPVIGGSIAELLASLYELELRWCCAAGHGFGCSRSSNVPHRIHVAHCGPGPNKVCTYDSRYAVWRAEEEQKAAPASWRAWMDTLDPLLKMQANRTFRFFASLDLRDQPLTVQREARDVLQALRRALRPGEVEK